MRQVKLPFWVLVKKHLAECEESSENTLGCDIFAYFQFGLEDQWTSYYLRHIQTDSGAAVNHHRVVRWRAGLLGGGLFIFRCWRSLTHINCPCCSTTVLSLKLSDAN